MTKQFDVPELSTRDRILKAAAGAFADKGYHGTGMAEIGDLAQIQRGALYYHIGSKEQLLYDLCWQHVELALAKGRDAVATSNDARNQFQALALAHLRTLAEHHSFVVIAEREMHVLTGDRARALKKLRRDYQDLFTTVMELGVEQGYFTSAEPIDVMSVMGMLNYTYVWLHPSGRINIEEAAKRICDLLLNGMNVR